MSNDLIQLWDEAASIDGTLKVREQHIPILKRKRVKPTPFLRSLMFSQMSQGQVCLFDDLQVPVRKNGHGDDMREVLAEGIRSGFPRSRTAGIQMGRSRQRCRMRIPEMMRRWQGGRSILSVTDLHIRETKFDEFIDTTPLSDFNILCNDPKDGDDFKAMIEMMSLVLSSKGNLTDNHTDDCDSTNHCFIGRKFWVAWDRIEGKTVGFQDVDRDLIDSQAAFDLEMFLSLPSSKWFTVEPGQTLFLPGNLEHKVITLEHYLGVGSFHVALPSYLRCLKRWIINDTHDVVPKDLLGKINQAVIRRLHKLQRASDSVQERWGLSQMKAAIEKWYSSNINGIDGMLLRNPLVAEFVAAARRV